MAACQHFLDKKKQPTLFLPTCCVYCIVVHRILGHCGSKGSLFNRLCLCSYTCWFFSINVRCSSFRHGDPNLQFHDRKSVHFMSQIIDSLPKTFSTWRDLTAWSDHLANHCVHNNGKFDLYLFLFDENSSILQNIHGKLVRKIVLQSFFAKYCAIMFCSDISWSLSIVSRYYWYGRWQFYADIVRWPLRLGIDACGWNRLTMSDRLSIRLWGMEVIPTYSKLIRLIVTDTGLASPSYAWP